MYKLLSRKGVLFGFLLAVLAIIITIVPLIGGLEAFNSVPEKAQAASEEGGIFMVGITATIVLLFAAVGLMVLLGLLGVFTNFKAAKKALIGLGLVLAFFGIFMAMSSTADVTGSLAKAVSDFEITDSLYTFLSALVTGTIMMVLLSVALIIIMEIWNFFKTA